MGLKKISWKDTTAIGLMLFSLFFGAGNLIFPPSLGQSAGSNLLPAMIGFLLTGVGLPLLGVLAIGISGSQDAEMLASRVHPVFATVLTVATYLTIGPLFALPRTGAVSYEVGIKPFLTADGINQDMSLFVYSVIFFGITYVLALKPGKIVDWVGKILTPLLLLSLGLLVYKVFTSPLGSLQAPVGAYAEDAFFKGFQEGYLTMDALASIVFGIIVISAVKEKGVTKASEVTKLCAISGGIAAAFLAVIYVSLAYLGSTSVEMIGQAGNGGIVLTKVARIYFGSFGNVVLGMAILFACLTTSIGLVSSCATFFVKFFPRLTYERLVLLLSVFSLIVANIGLNQLIAFSIPVLVAIYPLVIVLILLAFLERFFNGRSEVYRCSLFFTGIVSVVDGLNAANVSLGKINGLFSSYLPLFDLSMGWILPAIGGAVLGYILSLCFTSEGEADSI